MAGEVINNGTIHVAGNLVVAPEGTADVRDFLKEEANRGVDPSAQEDAGYSPVEPEVPGTEEEKAEAGEALAVIVIRDETARADLRKDALEMVIKYADRANRLRGFLVNDDDDPEKTPDNPQTAAQARTGQRKKAEKALKLACANCHHQDHCKLKEDLDLWLDVHPYKDSNKMRPGSTWVRKRESKLGFIDAIREDPDAHCDPKVRHQARRRLLKKNAA